MGYQETKAFINANIRQNGDGAIRGDILNTALNDILDSGHEEVNHLGQFVIVNNFTDSAELNEQISELYLDTNEENLQICKNATWLQVYNSDRTTLLAQFAIAAGEIKPNVVSGRVGYVLYSNKATTTDLSYVALLDKCKSISNCPILLDYLSKTIGVCESQQINAIIKEIYVDTTESNLWVKIYSNTFVQVWNSAKSSLIAQFTISANSFVRSAVNSKYSGVLFNDFDSVNIDDGYYKLYDSAKKKEFSPGVMYENSQYRFIWGNKTFDEQIAEMYLDTNLTGLKVRIYANWLQVYNGDTLYAQFAIEPNAIIQSVYGPKGYIVYTNKAQTSSIGYCDLIGPYNELEKNPILYQFAKNTTQRKYQVKKGGGGDYSSLLECVLEATKYMDSKIYVDAGEYDLISEFEDHYGADFFANYTASSVKGIILKNRVHIVFSTKAKVVCNYLGENDVVMQEFSPFNAGQYGFTLENLNLSAYHCRYCVHDERGTSTDAYCNIYINCNMYLDNRNSSWKPNQCIGGGLGVNGTIRILDSIFESEDTGVTAGIVSYHNSAGANAQSTVEFVNCYCKGIGTFRLSWYGTSTLITRAMVCGCSLGSAIINSSEAGANNNNTEIIEWNNVIR